MNRQWAPWIHIAATAITAMLLLSLTACSKQSASGDTDADEPRPGPGVVDMITGKAAVDAGQRAKDVIRESSEIRNCQLDESLEW